MPPHNHYRNAEYLLNVAALKQLPVDEGREVAFAGRSNAGKSSAINVITDIKGLARTSKTPGRTQHIVYFALDETRRLVDLPGYGYAKVPEAVKRHWQGMLQRYLETRESLAGLVLIMDVRHPLTDHDRTMLEWCTRAQMPVHILLTKADKLNRGPGGNVLQKVQRELAANYPNASAQLFSALKRSGLDEVRRVLDGWLGFNDGEDADKKEPRAP